MKPVLVACYSLGGHTLKIAEKIVQRCNADLEVIEDMVARTGSVGYGRSVLESLLKRKPDIKPLHHRPAAYPLVIIGTPVWCWTISSPVRSYVTRECVGLKRVAFFCTYGGSGADRALAELERLCRQAPAATLALTERSVEQRQYGADLDGFVRRLGIEGHSIRMPHMEVHAASPPPGAAT